MTNKRYDKTKRVEINYPVHENTLAYEVHENTPAYDEERGSFTKEIERVQFDARIEYITNGKEKYAIPLSSTGERLIFQTPRGEFYLHNKPMTPELARLWVWYALHQDFNTTSIKQMSLDELIIDEKTKKNKFVIKAKGWMTEERKLDEGLSGHECELGYLKLNP